jgi:hypothetical protein
MGTVWLSVRFALPTTPFLPNVTVNGRMSLQADIGGQPTKLDNVFSFFDTVICVHGPHEMSFGMTLEMANFKGVPAFDNGTFVFDGSRTGNAMEDFLLGLPHSFAQGSLRVDNDVTETSASSVRTTTKLRVVSHSTLAFAISTKIRCTTASAITRPSSPAFNRQDIPMLR